MPSATIARSHLNRLIDENSLPKLLDAWKRYGLGTPSQEMRLYYLSKRYRETAEMRDRLLTSDTYNQKIRECEHMILLCEVILRHPEYLEVKEK